MVIPLKEQLMKLLCRMKELFSRIDGYFLLQTADRICTIKEGRIDFEDTAHIHVHQHAHPHGGQPHKHD